MVKVPLPWTLNHTGLQMDRPLDTNKTYTECRGSPSRERT
jgi:hypothetical protein